MSKYIKCKIAIDNITSTVSNAVSTFFEKINWLYIRLMFIIGAVSQFFVSGKQAHISIPATWNTVLAVFFFSAIGLQFIIGMQAFNPRSANVWLLPSWKYNPFNLKQPLQLFHFGGWYMLASSISYFPSVIERKNENLLYVAIQVAIGLGLLVGVRLSVTIYRRKFKNA